MKNMSALLRFVALDQSGARAPTPLEARPRLPVHELEHADQSLSLAHGNVATENAEDDVLRHLCHGLERLPGERVDEDRRPGPGGDSLRILHREPQPDRAVGLVGCEYER